MQYLLTLQVSRYCMLALQSRVPPFSLHNSQLQLWRVGGGGNKYACVLTYSEVCNVDAIGSARRWENA